MTEEIEFRTDDVVLELKWVGKNFLCLSKNKLILLEGTDINTIVQKFIKLVVDEVENFVGLPKVKELLEEVRIDCLEEIAHETENC